MPNWTYNELVFENEKDYKTFKKYGVKYSENDKKDIVSFDVLLPMPEEMNITSGGDSFNNTYKKTRSLLIPYLNAEYNSEISQKDFIEKVIEKLKTSKDYEEIRNNYNDLSNPIAGFFNICRYGQQDWFDWRCAHWGTKWDACSDVIDEGALIVYFDTAWCNPKLWIKALAQKVNFTHSYQDEAENYSVTNVYKNGEIVEHIVEENENE